MYLANLYTRRSARALVLSRTDINRLEHLSVSGTLSGRSSAKSSQGEAGEYVQELQRRLDDYTVMLEVTARQGFRVAGLLCCGVQCLCNGSKDAGRSGAVVHWFPRADSCGMTVGAPIRHPHGHGRGCAVVWMSGPNNAVCKHHKAVQPLVLGNHLEERLVDQEQAQAPGTPPFWGVIRIAYPHA